jgi:hypothetical protein
MCFGRAQSLSFFFNHLVPEAMAANGNKWQLSGNILAADGHHEGREWLPKRQQMAAEWQLNGNKWQQVEERRTARG